MSVDAAAGVGGRYAEGGVYGGGIGGRRAAAGRTLRRRHLPPSRPGCRPVLHRRGRRSGGGGTAVRLAALRAFSPNSLARLRASSSFCRSAASVALRSSPSVTRR
jgi:hypothetical protein